METVQADIEGAVVDVDDYMAQVNTVIAVVSAILGAFAIIVLVFVWLGWKFFMVLGFVVSPLFVTGCMLLAGIGIIFSTFLSDICFELQVMPAPACASRCRPGCGMREQETSGGAVGATLGETGLGAGAADHRYPITI